ncbi:MAG: TetR/AcrR family transcriptional regulator [Candidatus Promineifilaceae bacterium]|jgi:AcrR family transcriptional regulator
MSQTFQELLIEARRQLIIDAAIEIIAEQGFQKTTIKQIATRAGIADGTIYNYFKNKDGILEGIIARLSEGEAADMSLAGAEHTDFSDFVEMFVNARMDEIDGRFQILKAVFPEMITNPELAGRLYNQLYAPMYNVVKHYFQEMIDDGQIEEVDPALAGDYWPCPSWACCCCA